jgi:hypothetical protein
MTGFLSCLMGTDTEAGSGADAAAAKRTAKPLPDRLSGIPTFEIDGTTFRCWVTDSGHRYEWRSTDGRSFAGRNEGSATAWASFDRKVVGRAYPTLKFAMAAAVGAAAGDAQGRAG